MKIIVSSPISDEEIKLLIHHMTNCGELPRKELTSDYKGSYIDDSMETWCDKAGVDTEIEESVYRLKKEILKRLNAMIPFVYKEYRKLGLTAGRDS